VKTRPAPVTAIGRALTLASSVSLIVSTHQGELGSGSNSLCRIPASGSQIDSHPGGVSDGCAAPIVATIPARIDPGSSGRADSGLYDADGLVLLCRFYHDMGGALWSNAQYHIGLGPQSERTTPPDPATLTSETWDVQQVILVNATGDQVRARRIVSLSPEFTARLYGLIRAQASRPFHSRQYDSLLKSINFRYHTSDKLVEVCSVRCEGGACTERGLDSA
jgi:hypothetical protein